MHIAQGWGVAGHKSFLFYKVKQVLK